MTATDVCDGFGGFAQWIRLIDYRCHFARFEEVPHRIEVRGVHLGDEERQLLATSGFSRNWRMMGPKPALPLLNT